MTAARPVLFVAAVSYLWAAAAFAVPITVPTPGGPVTINVSHAGPTGQLSDPEPPTDAGFRPPTIFAAPLPTGSGARALGQAGAFTAVADDATAASWNPAGLTQMEAPEVSAVYRFSDRSERHHSSSRDLTADRDDYNSRELNYLSAVYPFLLNGHNAVCSLNYQEAYDFTQRFTAQFRGSNQQTVLSVTNQTFSESNTNHYQDANQDVTTRTDVTTLTTSSIDQLLRSSLLTDMEFVQSGTIDALSPAFAMDLSPQVSIGVAVNLYTDGATRGNPITSSLFAEYSGTSDSYATVTDVRNSQTMVYLDGVLYSGPSYNPTSYPVSGVYGPIPFSETDVSTNRDLYTVEGTYREQNRTDQFYGINATLGALWAVSDRLTLGATVDLPWTGYGRQTKTVDHRVITLDSNLVQVAENRFSETRQRDVQYTFPLYWAVGALWRWSDSAFTSVDVNCTYWSQYTYKAEGEARINPLTGDPHSQSALDDCWSLRAGSEYLYKLSWTEIPLRGGLFWEQRPAAGKPDEFWGFSLGSGLSLGHGPGKVILDIAYNFEYGDDVMESLLSGQNTRTDVYKHQLFISLIRHF